MKSWFTIEEIDSSTYAISEYNHWEKVHSYLLIGNNSACLIDTGLGIGNIKKEVEKLTDLPVKVINTHAHWDHIGGNKSFGEVYIHKEDSDWLTSGFPVPLESIKKALIKEVDPIIFPKAFDIENYSIYQGHPVVLKDMETIELGERTVQIIHTPGHSPGHICIYEKERGYLFSGDLIYKGILYAFYPSTDPKSFFSSVLKISQLKDIKDIFPGHYDMRLSTKFLNEVKSAFLQLRDKNLLFQGSGKHNFKNFSVKF